MIVFKEKLVVITPGDEVSLQLILQELRNRLSLLAELLELLEGESFCRAALCYPGLPSAL